MQNVATLLMFIGILQVLYRYFTFCRYLSVNTTVKNTFTLESGIDVGQGITVGPGKFVKKNKHRALTKCRASEF